MSYYQNQIVILVNKSIYCHTFTNCVSKKVNDATDNDTSNLGVKRDFIVLKVEVAKLDINNFVNIPTGLKNEKADDLEIDN